jgi:hypothetical protein
MKMRNRVTIGVMTVLLSAFLAFPGFAAEVDLDRGNVLPLRMAELPSRIIIVAIDSLNSEYVDFDTTASGPGGLYHARFRAGRGTIWKEITLPGSPPLLAESLTTSPMPLLEE